MDVPQPVRRDVVVYEVFEEEVVPIEPVYEEIVEEYTPLPRRIQPQSSRQRQAESSHASSGAGDQEAGRAALRQQSAT